MKKEIWAGLILLLTAILCLLNSLAIGRECDRICAAEFSSMQYASAGDYEAALSEHERAYSILNSGRTYAGIFIHRSELSGLDDAFLEIKRALIMREPGPRPLYEKLLSLTDEIKHMESLKIDSVF